MQTKNSYLPNEDPFDGVLKKLLEKIDATAETPVIARGLKDGIRQARLTNNNIFERQEGLLKIASKNEETIKTWTKDGESIAQFYVD